MAQTTGHDQIRDGSGRITGKRIVGAAGGNVPVERTRRTSGIAVSSA